MEVPKIIALIAFLLNILLTCCYVDIIFKFRQTYQELEIPPQFPFPWFLFVPLIFAVGSLGYWFYLRNKERKKS